MKGEDAFVRFFMAVSSVSKKLAWYLPSGKSPHLDSSQGARPQKYIWAMTLQRRENRANENRHLASFKVKTQGAGTRRRKAGGSGLGAKLCAWTETDDQGLDLAGRPGYSDYWGHSGRSRPQTSPGLSGFPVNVGL